MNSGQEYSQLDEFTTTMNMPNMSNKLYQHYHNKIFNHITDIAWTEMLTAWKEETKLALEKSDIDHQGRPKIAIIADGAWSKWSYKTKYNTLSGVVSNMCKIFSKIKYYVLTT